MSRISGTGFRSVVNALDSDRLVPDNNCKKAGRVFRKLLARRLIRCPIISRYHAITTDSLYDDRLSDLSLTRQICFVTEYGVSAGSPLPMLNPFIVSESMNPMEPSYPTESVQCTQRNLRIPYNRHVPNVNPRLVGAYSM